MRALVFTYALLLGACAAPALSDDEAASARDCFRATDVSGFNVADSDRVSVRVGTRTYLLTVQGGTRDLNFDQTLAIDAGHSFVCVGHPLGVSVIGGDHPFRRPITQIERAPPRDAAAAPQN